MEHQIKTEIKDNVEPNTTQEMSKNIAVFDVIYFKNEKDDTNLESYTITAFDGVQQHESEMQISQIKSEMQSSSQIAEEIYDCKTYSQQLSDSDTLKMYSDENSYKCSKCPKQFKLRRNLIKHNRIHVNTKLKVKKLHKCKICDKMFRYNCILLQHLIMHTGEKPHKCSECNKQYFFKANLMSHLRTYHLRNEEVFNAFSDEHQTTSLKSNTNQMEIEMAKMRAVIKEKNAELKNKDKIIKQISELNLKLQEETRQKINLIAENIRSSVNVSQVNNLGRTAENNYGIGHVDLITQRTYLGFNEWIENKTLARLMSSKDPSKFVKCCARYVFGTETLEVSTVSGRTGNNTSKINNKENKPLDEEKLFIMRELLKQYLEETKHKGTTVSAELIRDRYLGKLTYYIGELINDIKKKKDEDYGIVKPKNKKQTKNVNNKYSKNENAVVKETKNEGNDNFDSDDDRGNDEGDDNVERDDKEAMDGSSIASTDEEENSENYMYTIPY